MGGPSNTLLIEGSFEELADELAVYVDTVQKNLNADAAPSTQKEVAALLEENKKDEALKKIVTGAEVMNSAPEKGELSRCSIRKPRLTASIEFIAAYNLLVHLIRQSPNLNMFLPKVCQNLQRPITTSPNNGYGLSLSILTTIFNIMQSDNDTRYHVFLSILKVVKAGGLYEMLKPQLENLDAWIEEWETDEEDQRKLYLTIADVADEVGETEYVFLTRTSPHH
jgi:translation initiation factor 3 subunit M